MKIIVCDICKANEDASQGGLFNLIAGEMMIDICGSCAVSVLATMLGRHQKETLAALEVQAEPLTHQKTLRETAKLPVLPPLDPDLEAFMAQHINGKPTLTTSEEIEKEIIAKLSADVGAQVFVQEFGQEQRIGSSVKIGMPGRKANRRVEVVEAVSGKPGSYYVFQVKD